MRQSLIAVAAAQHGLFTTRQALLAGYTADAIRHRVSTARWHRVHHSVYVEQHEPPSFAQRCAAAILVGPAGARITARAALRLHGVMAMGHHERVQIRVSYELAVMPTATVDVRVGLEPPPTVMIDGIPVVTACYACIELARSSARSLAVAVLDEVQRRKLVSRQELDREWRSLAKGARGRRLARQALDLSDPRAESPPESMLRLLIHSSGLPSPTLQHVIIDGLGAFVARTDLAYPELKIAIEYDGAATHRDDPNVFREDRRRQNRMIAQGWVVLRFTAADLFGEPEAVVESIRAAIRDASRRNQADVG